MRDLELANQVQICFGRLIEKDQPMSMCARAQTRFYAGVQAELDEQGQRAYGARL